MPDPARVGAACHEVVSDLPEARGVTRLSQPSAQAATGGHACGHTGVRTMPALLVPSAAAAGGFAFVCNPIVPSAAAMLCLAVFLFCGMAIGASGIGGVAVVPLLGVALEVPVKDAVHAVMAAYVIT
eukprot:COSAG02_NODE_32265_length_519_cov_0.792857_1_plen_126_part_10